jgi:hypothetical protein
MTGSLLVMGQSHVAAIRAAARIRREADPDAPRTRTIHLGEPRYAPELLPDDSGFAPPLVAAIRDQVDRHAPRIASCIGGNVHNVLGLMRHPRPFDFRLSEDDALDPAAEPLPLGLVRATLTQAMARDLLRLRLLAALVGPFVHLESPPPLRDDALIAARADAFFRDRALTSHVVAPAALRHRLWRLHGAIVCDACRAADILFLPVPTDVMDGHGFLDPAFAGDATHGNAAYGERMIRLIEETSWPA